MGYRHFERFGSSDPVSSLCVWCKYQHHRYVEFFSKLNTYETNLIFLSSTQPVLGVMLIMCHPDSNSSLVVVQLRAVSFITIVAPHFPFAICISEVVKLDCMYGQSQALSLELMDLTKLTFNSIYLITCLSTKADSKR